MSVDDPSASRENHTEEGGEEDSDPQDRMGPALTNEAAGLSELIRRRGGLSALSDPRGVAAVLRTAAPRRQSAFHVHPQQRQPRGFFDLEAEDGGWEEGGGAPLLLTPPRRGGGGEMSLFSRPGGGEDGGGGEEGVGPGGGSSTYVSTTCGGLFGTSKSPVVSGSCGTMWLFFILLVGFGAPLPRDR